MTENKTENQKMGFMMLTGMWVLLFIMLAFLFDNILENEYNPNKDVSGKVSDLGVKEVVLQRNRYGHYVTAGEINGRKVVFMLDTGATGVVVPEQLAADIGLKKGRVHSVTTANGVVDVFSTRLESVAIDNIALNDIRAMINPNDQMGEVLLGMSFLKHIEFTQRGDTLILRQYR